MDGVVVKGRKQTGIGLAVGLSLLLSGCGVEPKIKAGSETEVRASLASIQKGLMGQQKRRFAEASNRYLATYFPTGLGEPRPAGAPDWSTVNKMTVSDFIEYSYHLEMPPDVAPAPAANRYITESFLAQLEQDQMLLEVARSRADRDGLITIDKIDYGTPIFIPPPIHSDEITTNRATFTFNFTNRAAISVRDPQFEVLVKDPSNNQTYTIKLKEKDLTPAAPDVPVQYTMTCCGLADDPLMNRRMRQLPETATFTYRLIALNNYGRRDVLDLKRYTASDHQRYLKGRACIADIESRLETWSIDTASKACRS